MRLWKFKGPWAWGLKKSEIWKTRICRLAPNLINWIPISLSEVENENMGTAIILPSHDENGAVHDPLLPWLQYAYNHTLIESLISFSFFFFQINMFVFTVVVMNLFANAGRLRRRSMNGTPAKTPAPQIFTSFFQIVSILSSTILSTKTTFDFSRFGFST